MSDRSRWRDELDAETRATTALNEGLAGRALQVPGLTILFHRDASRVGERIALPELVSQRSVVLSRSQPHFFAVGEAEGQPLLESHLSRTPVHLAAAAEGGVLLLRQEHRGKVMVDGESLAEQYLVSRRDLQRGVPLLLAQRVLLWLHLLDPVSAQLPAFGLVGESPVMGRLRQEIARAASLDVSVLVRGESGSGKELVAHAVHHASRRQEQPYIALNMAAVPPSLAASELFGAAKGAFTGATARQGFFERAEGGSLFLDEIGETPPEVQALLLRCLENHEIQPVGAVKNRPVDVRVLAATDADLDQAIEEGRFRLPLLHRLGGYEIRLPPLRQRRDDIPRLLVHFLRQELDTLAEQAALDLSSPTWLTAERMIQLVAHDWPGNVRELCNVARKLALQGSQGGEELLLIQSVSGAGITDSSTEASVASATIPETPLPRPRPSYRKPSEVDEEELLAALAEHRWRLKPTAETLGVSRASLYLMIEACDTIRKAVDLTAEEIAEASRHTDGNLAAMAQRLEVSEQGLKRRMTSLGLR